MKRSPASVPTERQSLKATSARTLIRKQRPKSIVGAMLGAQLLSKAMPGGDHIERLRRMWELLLPAIVTDASMPYFREFLAREALRHIQPALSLE